MESGRGDLSNFAVNLNPAMSMTKARGINGAEVQVQVKVILIFEHNCGRNIRN